eukprot:m.379163 g.379163  ORF g.379163 m.379163 type:complete len:54 (-) comp28229_c0_seq4:1468-1629(-)
MKSPTKLARERINMAARMTNRPQSPYNHWSWTVCDTASVSCMYALIGVALSIE